MDKSNLKIEMTIVFLLKIYEMKNILIGLFFGAIFSYGQVQIGNTIEGQAAYDRTGFSVAMNDSGTIVAVGAIGNAGNNTGVGTGNVRIFENQAGNWQQIGAAINGQAMNDSFGFSVALNSSGSIVAIGAIYNETVSFQEGQVRIFENQSGVWTPLGQAINGIDVGANFGFSVDLSADGTIVAIGALNGNDTGSVSIYEYVSDTWNQRGQTLIGDALGDAFGKSLSLNNDGTILAVGASLNDANAMGAGLARVYNWNDSQWIQMGQDVQGEAVNDHAGYDVSLNADGSKLAVGFTANDTAANNAGQVRIYEYDSNVWNQIGGEINGASSEDFFGASIALNAAGNRVAAVAVGADTNGMNSGQLRLFEFTSGNWIQVGETINGVAAGDQMGEFISQSLGAVAINNSGTIVALGAYENDDFANNAGHVRLFDFGALSVSEFSIEAMLLFPNPANEKFTVQLPQGFELLETHLYNHLGQFISTTSKTTIDVSNLSQGVYIVEFITNKGKLSRKLIKE